MTGRDLYNQLIQFGEIDAPESSVVGWIDMCQKKSSLDLPVVHSTTVIDVVPGVEAPIPTGVFNVVSATCGDGSDYPLTQVHVTPHGLVFDEAVSSLVVKYTGIASDYTNLDNELTVHPVLHAPMVYYLISMYYDMEGEGDNEESSLAERYYQRWLYYRSLAISSLTGTDNDTFTRLPVNTVDELPRSRRRGRRESYYE